MGTIVSFRVGQNDVESLSRYFQPLFDAEDLLRIPNYNTITRTLIDGVPTQPFSMVTLPPLGKPNPKLADALKQLSAAKYGRPKATVEAEINERLVTKSEPAPPFMGTTPGGAPSYANPLNRWPTGAPTTPGAAAGPPAPRPPTSGSSFLDDWLAKRRSTLTPPSPVAPPNSPVTGGGALPPRPNPSPMPGAPVAGGQNISSNALEKQEVATIAHNLNQHPAPAPTPAAPSAPAQGEVLLNKDETDAPTTSPQDEDTIFIDREGNMSSADHKPDEPIKPSE